MISFSEDIVVDDGFIMEQIIHGINYLEQNPIDIDMLMDDSNIQTMEEELEFDFSGYQVDTKDDSDDSTTSSMTESHIATTTKMNKSVKSKNTKKAYKIRKNQCVALGCIKRVYMDSICRVHYSKKYGIDEKLLIEKCSTNGCEKSVYRDHFCKHCFVKVFPEFKCSVVYCPNIAYRDSYTHTCKTHQRNRICRAKGCKSKVDFLEDNFLCHEHAPDVHEQLEIFRQFRKHTHAMTRIFKQDKQCSAHV